jgi:hypothetical protein
MEVSGQFTPLPLYPQGKNPCYPLHWRLGGPQSRSGHCGEEKISQPLPGKKHKKSKRGIRRISRKVAYVERFRKKVVNLNVSVNKQKGCK